MTNYKFDLYDPNTYYFNKTHETHEVELSHEDFTGCTKEELKQMFKNEKFQEVNNFGSCDTWMVAPTKELLDTLSEEDRRDQVFTGFQLWFDENDVCDDWERYW